MARPVILIAHGSWHTPAHYRDLEAALISRGFRVFLPAMPSSKGRPFATQPAEDDIASLRSLAIELADQGNEIVALGHSYGGLVITEAMAGLGVEKCKAEGRPGGVKVLIYVTAFMLEEGKSIAASVSKTKVGFNHYEGDEKVISPGFDVGEVMYTDLPAEERAKWAALTVPTPKASSFYELKAFAYREIRTVFIFCELDKAFPFVGQKALVQRMQEKGVRIETESLPSGHFPSLSMPDKVADLVEKYA